jgi:hypothetical protein
VINELVRTIRELQDEKKPMPDILLHPDFIKRVVGEGLVVESDVKTFMSMPVTISRFVPDPPGYLLIPAELREDLDRAFNNRPAEQVIAELKDAMVVMMDPPEWTEEQEAEVEELLGKYRKQHGIRDLPDIPEIDPLFMCGFHLG